MKKDTAAATPAATTLLPLRKNLQTASQSMSLAQGGPAQGSPGQGQANAASQPPSVNTEAHKQIDAAAKQIMAAMTATQIKAIADMKITQ